MQQRTILGVDPGTAIAGYALLRIDENGDRTAAIGVWATQRRDARALRLADLARRARAFLETQRPDVAAIEGLFHHRNVQSALALAESRGVLLAALGEFGVAVVEYPPATVKLTICGSGSASKEDVQRAISRTFPALLVGLDASLPRDATDALAVALCHDVHARFDARTRRLGT